MSAISHRKIMNLSSAHGRATISSFATAVIGCVHTAILRIAKLFTQAAQAVAEQRMQKALIEAELYMNRYKHSSKNDDDLQVMH
jgi:hypothetical protein